MSTQEKSNASKLSTIVTLEDAAFTAPIKRATKQQFAIWIYTLMQNWRQGTVGVKGRSDVARSNKKPWKQKGTGRARAGSARSPLWRGGGVIFGPQPHTKTLRVNKQLKKQVLGTLTADFLNDKKVHMVNWSLPEDKPKTKHAMQLLKDLDLHTKKLILFLRQDDANMYASFINIPHVQVMLFDQPNAFDLSNADCWLYLKKDHDAFKEMVGQWHN
jgi:large subunit ribosomal protein L4